MNERPTWPTSACPAGKCAHGRLANAIIAVGVMLHTERVCLRAWQRVFGRSIANRAPGTFLAALRRKAEWAGGWPDEFPTSPARLSQVCVCGRKPVKKRNNERFHDCDCAHGDGRFMKTLTARSQWWTTLPRQPATRGDRAMFGKPALPPCRKRPHHDPHAGEDWASLGTCHPCYGCRPDDCAVRTGPTLRFSAQCP
ncbi:MAG: hypothetical protein LBR22_04230 [Desulfovibrio sp.]|nr:hypothetical protein [Desulfovibrio sp.]